MSQSTNFNPAQAGLDMATGHGADTFFNDLDLKDPWASECLGIILDTICNHQKIFCPLPNNQMKDGVDLSLLSLIYRRGLKDGWMEIGKEAPVHEVYLCDEDLAGEYEKFCQWAVRNRDNLSKMIAYQQLPRRSETRQNLVPEQFVDKFWNSQDTEALTIATGISDKYLNFAFNAIARAAQYHHVLGADIPYFPHPAREVSLSFLPNVMCREHQWSWGRYFVQAIEQGIAPRDLDWVLDQALSVQELIRKNNATWYLQNTATKEDQKDLLYAIAADCSLPAKIKAKTLKKIRKFFSAGAALGSMIPIINVILAYGNFAVHEWKGTLPGKLGSIKAFRGQLSWPGLVE